MSTATEIVTTSEETEEQQIYGIGAALEYVAGEAKSRGLPFTAHLSRMAAEACWQEADLQPCRGSTGADEPEVGFIEHTKQEES